MEQPVQAKNNKHPRHPFALTSEQLHAATGELSPDGLLASIAAESAITLKLPSVDGRPLPSSCATFDVDRRVLDGESVLARESFLGPIRHQSFSVTALVFSAADTIDLLTGLSEVAYENGGDSLRYWRILARYALSLLSRQQFVPAIEDNSDKDFTGRWRVFVTDRQEMAWLERLVRAIPPVCLALETVAPGTVAPASRRWAHRQDASGTDTADPLPTHIADTFLSESCEAVIRRSLSNDAFFDQIHARAKKEDKWELSWLSALMGRRRRVRWKVEGSAEIVGQIRSWIGKLEHGHADPSAELCFTLIEPSEQKDADRPNSGPEWFVRFDLRSIQTGELLDMVRIWQEPSEAPSILGQHLIHRREHLRSELARAAAIYPKINAATEPPSSPGLFLNTHEAESFIREQAPLLRAQGFAVHLPAWTEDHDHQLGLELFLQPNGGTSVPPAAASNNLALESFGLNMLMDFQWRVAIGDRQLSLEEFEALADQNVPLVKVRGQWVAIDHDAAKKALTFIKQRRMGRISLAEALRMSAGGEELGSGLPIFGITGTDWVKRLLDKSPSARIEDIEQPIGFNGTMRPYQLRGLAWLAFLDRLGLGACLADDMGLGKTIQLIALLLHERSEAVRPNCGTCDPPVVLPPSRRSDVLNEERLRHRRPGPTLLFVPMSVVGNWQREIHRFAESLRVLVHHGQERLTNDAFINAALKHDIVITTYGLAHRDIGSFSRIHWHRIALDEAQKIKNPSARQTLAIRSLRANHRIALTGTPLENHLSELWSIMEMLNPDLLGSASSFRKRFALPIEKMGDSDRAQQLRRMIRPFLLRRLKNDPDVECDLPEKMEMKVYCNLTAEQAALYQQTVGQMLNEIEQSSGIRRRGLILATLTRLKQICNHPVHFLQDGSLLDNRSGKCERLVEMLEVILEEGDEALVFTQYKVMGKLLEQLLAARLRIPVLFLHGGTTIKEREKMIDEFQRPGGSVRVFILSLRAGGFGLNLTKANHVFHFDRWWNPAVEQQATDRAHRIGQTRRVQVHKFISIGTIEDRIDRLLTEKAALANQIIVGGEKWLTGLTNRDLRSYLALSVENEREE